MCFKEIEEAKMCIADAYLVRNGKAVVEPSLESLSVAQKIKTLTESGGARFAGAVINKYRSEAGHERLVKEFRRRAIPELGRLRFHERLFDDGLAGLPVNSEKTLDVAGAIVDNLYIFIREVGAAKNHG
jgi:CO dehydrogenase nickel-insertion accessory protein CooC1